ncbi:MAG: DDE-type integrase/transposase/recombinase [Candidatus Hadarchaeum sp.]|uniref:DDE-type integrase/transposase/recombinase n=1 Tax=Candidatus Hadarchaeum sp. TaxID=2883567 RepID=UPI003D14042A
MPRLNTDQRRQMVKVIRQGMAKKDAAEAFGVGRQTAWKWCKRAKHRGRESFRDLPRKPRKGKITKKVEASIVALRTTFGWGTARIRQALINLPGFMRRKLKPHVQGIRLSRTAINGVLNRFGLNGYGREEKAWKFFRAKKPDELWQLDVKGPFWLQGRKYWFPVCVDDFSRYLLVCEQFDHEPTTDELTGLLEELRRKPGKILTDRGAQFKERWKRWCREKGIEPLFAHPYYPQDKGKVERTIRNVAEEFVNLLRKFPEWLARISEYRRWYNCHRFHRGIDTQPAKLYPALI